MQLDIPHMEDIFIVYYHVYIFISVRPIYRLADIFGQNTSYRLTIGKLKILVLVSVADMLVLIYRYRQKYRLGEYIGIGCAHIGPTLRHSPLNRLAKTYVPQYPRYLGRLDASKKLRKNCHFLR